MYYGIDWVFLVIPTVFGRLGHLPQLKEVDFDGFEWASDNILQAASLLLPSPVKLRGEFYIEMPESCWNSETPGKLFDVIKYNTCATLEPITPSLNSSNSLYLAWAPKEITIHSNDATSRQLESLAGHIAEHNCLEQLVCITTCHLQKLYISINLSQVQDVIDCLRLLIHLQSLGLEIKIEDSAKNLNWAPRNTTCRDLRVFSVSFNGDEVPGIVLSTQRTLHNLFSTFETLYPSVEDFDSFGHSWPFFASSYLRSLPALKSLSLRLDDSKHNPPEGPINLQSLQCLVIDDPAYLDILHMPNLLKLTLDLPNLEAWPTHLSHPQIRSLSIRSQQSTQDFKVLSLDCIDLRHLRLDNIPLWVTWELLSLSNVVSITLISHLRCMVNPSSNQLCLALLCYPERLPALQQLHFNNNVDWDILFLMLQRRNLGQIGVKRIDTVTLPFIPFVLRQPLACLLTGEIVEIPPLASLSPEATREVMFDPTVYVHILWRG
jgi:hypothetical protein